MRNTVAAVLLLAASAAAQVRFTPDMHTSQFANAYLSPPTAATLGAMNARYARGLVSAPFFNPISVSYTHGWIYKDLYAVDPSVAAVHPEYVLKDNLGHLLFIPFQCGGGQCTQYAGDAGLPAFRTQWIADMTTKLGGGTYAGMLIDDVDLDTINVGNGNGTPVVPIDPRTGIAMTLANYRSYMAGMLQAIRSAFPTKEIVHNTLWFAGDAADDPSIANQIAAGDVMALERGVIDPGIVGGATKFGFQTLLRYVDNVHSLSKAVWWSATNATGDPNRTYQLATYFLNLAGNDSEDTYELGTPVLFWAPYLTQLGAPGTRTLQGDGVYKRPFAGGVVYVNPPGNAQQTETLGGTFADVAGNVVTTVTLPTASGTVLSSILPPTNVVGQVLSCTSVKLSWSAVAGATQYCVTHFCGGPSLGCVAAPATSITLAALPTVNASYTVQAEDANGNFSPCNPLQAIFLACPSCTCGSQLCGDVNGDGQVNIGDSLVIAQFAAGQIGCGQGQMVFPGNCDVTHDGLCGNADASAIANCLVTNTCNTLTCTPFSCAPGAAGGSCTFERAIDGPGTPDTSNAWGVSADSAGNFYIVGQATGTLDFGAGGIAGQTSPRAWVAKYTGTNSLVWGKRFGTTTNFASDATYGVASTPAGIVTITGSFGEPVDFGGGTITNAGADIFTASYQTNGTFRWAKAIGMAGTNIGRAVAVDASGNVFVAGSFQATADFGNGINVTSAGGKDVFLVKYDPNGTFLWAKQFGSTSDDEAFGVAVDPVTGNVTMVGSFQGTVAFGGGALTSAGATDIFIATYDPSGTHLRSNRYGNTGSDIAYAVAADASGNIVVTGQADLGTQNFGGATFTNPAGPDIFLVKYNAAGVHQWSALYGTNSSSDTDTGYGVAFDAAGNVGLTGTILGSVNFGGGSLVGGSTFDIFAAKFTAAGTHVWSKRYVSDFADLGRGVTFDATGAVGLAGYFTNTLDLGCGVLSPTNGVFSQSAFLGKLTP